MNIYLICGYGIPKDINNDQSYLTYLHLALNRVYELSSGKDAALIFCGGPTNCEPPFEGTEAYVMAEYVRSFIMRDELREKTALWKVLEEDRSLSTLENLLCAKELIEEENIEGQVVIFCEYTRRKRLEAFGDKLFGDQLEKVFPIDFDVSKNRYIDSGVLQKKEDLASKEGLWTLEDPERIALHHVFFEKKFAFFRERQAAGVAHVDVVEEWFTKGPELLKELMPDHPLLN